MVWPLLHAGNGATGPFLSAWNLSSGLWLGLLLAAGAYLLGWRWLRALGRYRVSGWQALAFLCGIAGLAFALLGPLDIFNDDLFLVHMLQHVLLMLVAAPLLVLGRPVHLALRTLPPRLSRPVLRAVLRRGSLRGALTVLANPVLVFVLFNLNLVVWHIPGIYTLALENDVVHEIEHATFFGTALLFWWIIIDPIPRHHRVSPHWAIVLLFASGTIGDLLGLTLLLSPRVLYSFYLRETAIWGVSPILDQQLSGGIMLASGTLVFFDAVFLILRQATLQSTVPPLGGQPPPAASIPRPDTQSSSASN